MSQQTSVMDVLALDFPHRINDLICDLGCKYTLRKTWMECKTTFVASHDTSLTWVLNGIHFNPQQGFLYGQPGWTAVARNIVAAVASPVNAGCHHCCCQCAPRLMMLTPSSGQLGKKTCPAGSWSMALRNMVMEAAQNYLCSKMNLTFYYSNPQHSVAKQPQGLIQQRIVKITLWNLFLT